MKYSTATAKPPKDTPEAERLARAERAKRATKTKPKKKTKSRINRPKSDKAKLNAAPVASSFAGEHWDWEAGSTSYRDYFTQGQRRFWFKKLPSWEKTNQIIRLQLVNEYMLSNPDLTALHFSFNLSPKTAQTLSKATDLSYARDQVRNAFKQVLGEEKVYFWMVDEYTPKAQRMHFHGVIAVRNELESPNLLLQLTKSLSGSSLSRKRVERSKESHPAFVHTYYEFKQRGKLTLNLPVDTGFLAYAMKTKGRKRLTGEDGKVTRQSARFCISHELTAATRDAYTVLRKETKPVSKRSGMVPTDIFTPPTSCAHL